MRRKANMQGRKSIFARLLGRENITIIHRPDLPTAAADVKNRVLYCPLWKDMSGDLYDLLMSHEISHMLNTPPEGWHDAIDVNGPAFKGFLNICEDARIERLIQRKFPGLRPAYKKGYAELIKNFKFFGADPRPETWNKMLLIDRLNIHFKLAKASGIEFDDTEEEFVTRMDELSTFEEARKLAEDLFEKCKEEMSQTSQNDVQSEFGEGDGEGEGEGDGEGEGEGAPKDGEDGEEGNAVLGGREGGDDGSAGPVAQTDEEFRKNTKKLNDKATEDFITLPKIDDLVPENCIVPHNEIHGEFTNKVFAKELKKTVKKKDISGSINSSGWEEKYHTHRKTIAYLVKEFTMKMAADVARRAVISKTGVLDTRKLKDYRLVDDVFKRHTNVPEGKSHGLVMFIDWSGSMSDIIQQTVEQTIVLAVFCQKVGIPFDVYAFYSSGYGSSNWDNHYGPKAFPSDLGLERCKLLNFLSSRMSPAEFKRSCNKFYEEAENLQHHRSRAQYSLGGTPLNASIVLARKVVHDFRELHDVQIVNTIFLTDGYSNFGNETRSGKHFDTTSVVVNDRESGKVYQLRGDDHGQERGSFTDMLLKSLGDSLDINVIGFFLQDQNGLPGLREGTAKVKRKSNYDSIYANKGSVNIPDVNGYTEFFVINSQGSNFQGRKMSIGGKNQDELTASFKDNRKRLLTNKVFLNRFVELIAI